MSVIVRIEDIPAEGLDVSVTLPGGALGPEGVLPSGSIRGEFHIARHGAQVLARGRVRGRVLVACSRCLSEAEALVDEAVSVEFRPLEEGGGGEHELAGGELDVEFYRDGAIDMREFLTGQVRLALPMKPLCSDRCPGLCPVCGRSRRDGCGCGEKPADDRWDALRGLLPKDDNKMKK